MKFYSTTTTGWARRAARGDNAAWMFVVNLKDNSFIVEANGRYRNGRVEKIYYLICPMTEAIRAAYSGHAKFIRRQEYAVFELEDHELPL